MPQTSGGGCESLLLGYAPLRIEGRTMENAWITVYCVSNWHENTYFLGVKFKAPKVVMHHLEWGLRHERAIAGLV